MAHVLAALLAGLLFIGSAPAAAQGRILSVPSGLKNFLGAALQDFAGQPRATITDLELDLANGGLRYAILDVQGRRIAYPFERLEVSIDGRRLITHDSAERLARAPAIDDCAGSPRWAAYWAGSATPRLAAASKLIGQPFRAPDGAGRLVDIVIDAADGRVAFAVVRLPGKRLHAVPLYAFVLQGGELAFALPITRLDPRRDIPAAALADLRDRPELARWLARYADALAR